MYMLSSPIILWQSLLAVRKVKLAFCLHNLQIAVSFFIFSHLGMRSRTAGKAVRIKVPCKEEIITNFPEFAACSENETMSGKN